MELPGSSVPQAVGDCAAILGELSHHRQLHILA